MPILDRVDLHLDADAVLRGQRLRFSLLGRSHLRVKLTQTLNIIPLKSLSLILGLGVDLDKQEIPSDCCTMRNVCQYQTDYAKTR